MKLLFDQNISFRILRQIIVNFPESIHVKSVNTSLVMMKSYELTMIYDDKNNVFKSLNLPFAVYYKT